MNLVINHNSPNMYNVYRSVGGYIGQSLLLKSCLTEDEATSKVQMYKARAMEMNKKFPSLNDSPSYYYTTNPVSQIQIQPYGCQYHSKALVGIETTQICNCVLGRSYMNSDSKAMTEAAKTKFNY